MASLNNQFITMSTTETLEREITALEALQKETGRKLDELRKRLEEERMPELKPVEYPSWHLITFPAVYGVRTADAALVAQHRLQYAEAMIKLACDLNKSGRPDGGYGVCFDRLAGVFHSHHSLVPINRLFEREAAEEAAKILTRQKGKLFGIEMPW